MLPCILAQRSLSLEHLAPCVWCLVWKFKIELLEGIYVRDESMRTCSQRFCWCLAWRLQRSMRWHWHSMEIAERYDMALALHGDCREA